MMRAVALALVLVAAGLASPAGAQPPPAAETRAQFGGHTTTFVAPYRDAGPTRITLALLSDGTGRLFMQAEPGGTMTPRQRQIYRWWVAEDGRLCYHYSPAPDRMSERSFWSCWFVGRGADARPALVTREREPFPVVSRIAGNGLAGMNHFFRDAVQRTYPGGAPTPQPPLRPPPP
jgi:hypothetical protein